MKQTPSSSSPDHRRISVRGVDLNVQLMGQGPAVLLLHGFPDDHTVWRHQVTALVAAGYQVIAPDLRGCGESAIPPKVSDYHVDELLADLVALLDALGLEKVFLAGHDWGAAIGWFFATRHPERVHRYAAMSVGHPTAYASGGWEQKLKAWYTLFFQLRGLTEFICRFNNWASFVRFMHEPIHGREAAVRLSRPGRLTAGLNYYRANVGLVIPRKMPPVQVPVMGVFSMGDRFLAESQMIESAQHVAADWRYERIEGVGHWMPLDAPEQVNALLLDFFGAGSK